GCAWWASAWRRGRARSVPGELAPRHHAGAGAPRDRGHVGEDVGWAAGHRENEEPGEELRGAARARLLHALERALGEQRLVVAFREQVEEPPVELLVHPEVARTPRLVRAHARLDHGDPFVDGVRVKHVTEHEAAVA